MTTFFKDPEANKFMAQTIHKLWGKKAGLLEHEYIVHFVPELRNNEQEYINYKIHAGKVINIFVRTIPSEEYWARTCRLMNSIFLDNPHKIRSFLRSGTSLVRKTDAIQWYGISLGGEQETVENSREGPDGIVRKRKIDVNSYTISTRQILTMRDKKSKKFVTIEITNGNMFEAVRLAEKSLYGDRLE